MGACLGVARAGSRSARAIAAHSRSSLDRPLRYPAELWVAVARDEALLAGAFQRCAAPSAAASLAGGHCVPPSRAGDLVDVLRRGSGGPDVFVGEGTIHVVLSLAEPGALVPSDESHIVNRLVRPLLKALTKTGSQAHFFGRDWVRVTNGTTRAPAGWVGFAHDATTRRTALEAFVAVRTPYALRPGPSLRGKVQGTLESIAGRAMDAERIAEAIAVAYGECATAAEAIAATSTHEDSSRAGRLSADPPWAATCEEAIGWLGAGPDASGTFRVGGDLLVSRDALARLEARATVVPDEEVGALVDATLGAPGVAVGGVRSLASVREVIVNARRTMRAGDA